MMKNDLTAVRQSHRSVVAYQRRLRDAMALFHREM